ncbi:hypothetical protein KJ762_11805 [bacterium]|nr:hypothetical protein [bacterium]MBU1063902.1 hypothetical protein [bacterium]MBU1635176.1 hypothetical protein [bacterium]MBU1874372.1 hypothetical protein [bacterium]
MKNQPNYSLTLIFEEVKLPPFQDILILGSKCPQGKVGISKCMHFLAPDDFELFEIEKSHVEAVLISKNILQRMSGQKVIKVLEEKVFPYITSGEIIKVDLKVRITYENIEIKPD